MTLSARSRRLLAWSGVLLCLAGGVAGWLRLRPDDAPDPTLAPGPDARFAPVLVSAEFFPPQVRPGDELSYLLRWRNDGTAPAEGKFEIFVHFEPEHSAGLCRHLVFQDDHVPLRPTDTWEPGVEILDGPHVLRVPASAPDGPLALHLGIFSFEHTGWRVLDVVVPGPVLSRSAALTEEWHPEPLDSAVLAERRRARSERLGPSAQMEGQGWRFSMDRRTGAWDLADTRTGALWGSDPRSSGLARIDLRHGERVVSRRIERVDSLEFFGAELVARTAVELPGGEIAQFDFRVRALDARAPWREGEAPLPGGVELGYELELPPLWQVEAVHLIDAGLLVADTDGGALVLPRGTGQWLTTDQGRPTSRPYRTYDQLSMAMCGMVQGGSGLLVHWNEVSADLIAHVSIEDHPSVPGRRVRSHSLVFPGEAGGAQLRPVGAGGFVEIARAYRNVARERGWLRTLEEKRAASEVADRLPGSMKLKPTAFLRLVPRTRLNPGDEEILRVETSFAEVAERAEWLHRRLEIDRALVILTGWNYGGYDNLLPTVLPAAAPAGGDEGLADCARRVRRVGYLFGLHDNYQDMYPISPDWKPELLNLGPTGRPKQTGEWAGGTAMLVCSSQQALLAQRNFAELKQRFELDLHFLDAGFAWPLVPCDHPAHPIGRAEDLAHKVALHTLANRWIGATGTEGGREPVLAEVLFLEGLMPPHVTETRWAARIPLFHAVYGDCVKVYPSLTYSDRVGLAGARRFVDSLLVAESPFFDPSIGSGFGDEDDWVLPLDVRVTGVERGEDGSLLVEQCWTVQGPLEGEITGFMSLKAAGSAPDVAALAGDEFPLALGLEAAREVRSDLMGLHVTTAALVLAGSAELADGIYELHGGVRMAGKPQRLVSGTEPGALRYLGRLRVQGPLLRFTPPDPGGNERVLARGDGGWAQDLGAHDRLVKNCFEVATWVDRICADRSLDGHRFLDERRDVQETRFGDLTIAANRGRVPFALDGTILPPYGFLVQSPGYEAFLALHHRGRAYPGGMLATLRSLDGRPLEESRQVRVYRGFGSGPIRLWGENHAVGGETVLRR